MKNLIFYRFFSLILLGKEREKEKGEQGEEREEKKKRWECLRREEGEQR